MEICRQADFVFPGDRRATLSDMSMLMLLRRMDRADLTAHGFRSSFRDWAAECTSFPNEVVEMALAHSVGSKVEAAYRRGDLFEKRRRLMDVWADFVATAPTTSSQKIVAWRSGHL
jgi:integrase